MHIHREAFTKIWLHTLLWVLMILYFLFAPDVFTLFFTQNGKPVQTDVSIPAESDRIHFVIEDLAPYVKDGEHLYELIGWSFIVLDEGIYPDLFVREIALVSNEGNYFFSVRSGHRKPAYCRAFRIRKGAQSAIFFLDPRSSAGIPWGFWMISAKPPCNDRFGSS